MSNWSGRLASVGSFVVVVALVVAAIVLFVFTNSNVQELEGRTELRRWILEQRAEATGANAADLAAQAACLEYVSRIGLSVGDNACAPKHPCGPARQSFLVRWFPGEGYEDDCGVEVQQSPSSLFETMWNSVAWSSMAIGTAVAVLSGTLGGLVVSIYRGLKDDAGPWEYLRWGLVGSLLGGLAGAVVFWVLRAGVGAVTVEGEASGVANGYLLAVIGLAAGSHAPRLGEKLVSFTTWLWEAVWSSPGSK